MNPLCSSLLAGHRRSIVASAVAAILIVALATVAVLARRPAAGAIVPDSPELVSTFSIVAFDPETGDLGVAVQSKFFAVGRVVPFAAAGVGALATQSYANTTYGPRGLELLAGGHRPESMINALIADDEDRGLRQLGVVDAAGNAANFTGSACLAWAGARSGPNYTVQGNILAGPEVVDAMATAFESTGGELATRMVAALAAGQEAGGDVRGRQSAALLVVREGAGYGGYDDRWIDVRVDDHVTPIDELRRLLGIHQGREADGRAVRLLATAADASGAERPALLQQAIDSAERATEMDPANGWVWMTLAEARLASGDLESAAAAGSHALALDPWIKTAVLNGILGSARTIEALLEDESFRRAWTAISVR